MRRFAPASHFELIFRRYPEIERIVSSPEACALMRDMTELELPAVAALHHVPGFTELALRIHDNEEFEGQYDNFKQMVGSLVKDVMAELGYEEARPGSPIETRISPIFTKGAFYRPIDGL